MKKLSAILATALVALAVAGCNDWERRTFQTLSSTKAAVDQAQKDYEAGTIPRTQTSFNVISQAKKAQTMAVDAFKAYQDVKAAKPTPAQLNDAQAKVEFAMVDLPGILVSIKSLYGGK